MQISAVLTYSVQPISAPMRLLARRIFDFAVFTSFFVMIEPAPTDLLFILLIPVLLLGGVRKTRVIGAGPMVGVAFYLIFSFVSTAILLDAASIQWNAAIRALAIETYMILIFLVTAYFAKTGGDRAFLQIMLLWLAGAVIAAALGVLAKLGAFGDSALFFRDTFRIRVSSTFKDPNVFGPFIIPPMLLCLWIMAAGPLRRAVPAGAAIGLLAAGLVVTYSRGAWFHAALSLVIFALVLLNDRKTFHGVAVTLIGGLLCAPFLLMIFSNGLGAEYLESRLTLQTYDDERFSAIIESTNIALEKPFGIGPNQGLFASIILPHNTFIVFAYHNGILAAFGFCIIFFDAFYRCFIGMVKREPGWVKYGFLFSIFAGLFVLMNVIGAIHWRYLFLLMGLAYGEYRQNDLLTTPSARRGV